MSLIVGVTNGREIVVGADSKVYEGDEGNCRTYTDTKVRLLNQGKWVTAFTGLGATAKAVWNYLEASGETYDADIKIGALQFVEKFKGIYQKFGLDLRVNVLLAGFSGATPFLYRAVMVKPELQGGDNPPWCAIGCGVDVALHFVTRAQPLDEMNTQELMGLTYFSIAEIAGRDFRVGKPIDIFRVTREGVSRESREFAKRFDSIEEGFERDLRRRIKSLGGDRGEAPSQQ